MASIAQVEPLTSARALRGPFDYALPEEMRDSVGVGSMLVVPFGRRELLGVVVGLTEASAVADDRLLAPRRWSCRPGPAAAFTGWPGWSPR